MVAGCQPRRLESWRSVRGLSSDDTATIPASISFSRGGTPSLNRAARAVRSPMTTVRSGMPNGACISCTTTAPDSARGNASITFLATGTRARSLVGANCLPGCCLVDCRMRTRAVELLMCLHPRRRPYYAPGWTWSWCRTAEHDVTESLGGVGLHPRKYVLVGLHGEGNAGVTKAFADYLHRFPLLEHERGVRVPHVV